MKPSIGFSVPSSLLLKFERLNRLLADMLKAGCTAIELHANLEDYSSSPMLPLESANLIKRFLYRSIHLPIIYGLDTNQEALAYCRSLASIANAHVLVLHPDTVSSVKSVADQFDTRLAIENMDWRKKTGRTVKDLKAGFKSLSQLRWVCDLNHVKTNDPTMKLAGKLHQAFADRLVHYHVSGFDSDKAVPHVPLYKTGEDEIINALRDFSKPIILESFGPHNIQNFPKELAYLKARLKL